MPTDIDISCFGVQIIEDNLHCPVSKAQQDNRQLRNFYHNGYVEVNITKNRKSYSVCIWFFFFLSFSNICNLVYQRQIDHPD